MKDFTEVFFDDTKNAVKIKTQEYLAIGKHLIIDQGVKLISGYTNREEGIYYDVPAIIFGDHSRRFKIIESPFFIGADGVKVLKLKNSEYNYRFLYYFLSTQYIPDTGYNRHFKWVKNFKFPDISKQNQYEIVKRLDLMAHILSVKHELLLELDNLIKSRFAEVLYNSKCKELYLNEIFSIKTGKLDSNAASVYGKYPFFTCSKEVSYIDEYAFDQEALLLAGNNAAGKYDVKYYKGKFNAYQRTYILTLLIEGYYSIFKYQLEDKLQYLQSQSKGSTTRYLTLKILNKLRFLVPSNSVQMKLDRELREINKLKSDVQKSIDETQLLMDSLMQEYFG